MSIFKYCVIGINNWLRKNHPFWLKTGSMHRQRQNREMFLFALAIRFLTYLSDLNFSCLSYRPRLALQIGKQKLIQTIIHWSLIMSVKISDTVRSYQYSPRKLIFPLSSKYKFSYEWIQARQFYSELIGLRIAFYFCYEFYLLSSRNTVCAQVSRSLCRKRNYWINIYIDICVCS